MLSLLIYICELYKIVFCVRFSGNSLSSCDIDIIPLDTPINYLKAFGISTGILVIWWHSTSNVFRRTFWILLTITFGRSPPRCWDSIGQTHSLARSWERNAPDDGFVTWILIDSFLIFHWFSFPSEVLNDIYESPLGPKSNPILDFLMSAFFFVNYYTIVYGMIVYYLHIIYI